MPLKKETKQNQILQFKTNSFYLHSNGLKYSYLTLKVFFEHSQMVSSIAI